MAKPPPTSFGERTIQIDSSPFGSKMASRCVWRYFVPDLDRHIPRCLRRGIFNEDFKMVGLLRRGRRHAAASGINSVPLLGIFLQSVIPKRHIVLKMPLPDLMKEWHDLSQTRDPKGEDVDRPGRTGGRRDAEIRNDRMGRFHKRDRKGDNEDHQDKDDAVSHKVIPCRCIME